MRRWQANLAWPRSRTRPGNCRRPVLRRSIFERDLKWLEAIDEHLLAYQLRQVPTEVINGSEATLRAFIQRQLKKTNKTTVDRDKIDWLLVQYFALCAPEELYRQEIKLPDVAPCASTRDRRGRRHARGMVRPARQDLSDLEQCHSLRDVMENGIFEQGRLLKDRAGDKFYDPTVLVAFCRFNFLLRRAFIRLLHADLKSMGEAIDVLEARGKKTIDCRRAGFSAAETTAQLRYFCANWKQPFQKDYTESSVTRSLEQLLALRTDLEEALRLAHADGPPGGRSIPREAAAPESRRTRGVRPGSLAGKVLATLRRTPAVSSPGGSEAEKCLQAIREQLVPRFRRRRPLDVDRYVAGHLGASLFVGGGGLCERRWPGVRRFAAVRDRPSASHGRHGAAKALGRSKRPGLRTEASPQRMLLLSGPGSTSQTNQQSGSCGKSRDQREAPAFFHRRGRESPAVTDREHLPAAAKPPSVLIVSDDPEFARMLVSRWQSERFVPGITVATSDMWRPSGRAGHDLIIAGFIRSERRSLILSFLGSIRE